MNKIFWLLFYLLPGLIFSQNLSPIFKSENAKVDALCQQAREQMMQDPDNLRALKTAEQAKQIAIGEGENLAIAKTNATLGWIFLNGNNLDAAKSFVEKAFLNLKGENEPEAQAMLHHQMAIVLDKMSQPQQALRYYLHSIGYYQRTNNHLKLIQVYSEIARLYLITGNRESYDRYARMSEELLKKYPHNQMQLVFNNQKNFLLMQEHRYDEAYRLSMESVALAKKTNNAIQASTAYYNAAGALFELGRAAEADAIIEEGMRYAMDHKLDYTDFLLGKAQILSKQGRAGEAEKLFSVAIDGFVKEKNAFMEMQTRRLLANFYREQQQNEKAAGELFAYKKIEDSLSSAKQAVALKEVEYQYKDME